MTKLKPDKELEIAKRKFYEFCQYEGCDHISGEYALYILLKLCKTYNIKSVLEIGLGIGCIADTLLFYYNSIDKPITYVGTEPNEFCLNALNENTKFYEDIKIYDNVNEISNNKFDLIIIDGGDTDLLVLESLVKKDTILFVEGCRKNQFDKIMKLFPKAIAVDVISIEKNRDYSPFIKSHWMGGGRIIFINPSLKNYIYYLKEKLNTKVKYANRRRMEAQEKK